MSIRSMMARLMTETGAEATTSISAEDNEGRKYSASLPGAVGGGDANDYAKLGAKTGAKCGVSLGMGAAKVKENRKNLSGSKTAELIFQLEDTERPEDACHLLAVACGAVKPDVKADDKPAAPPKTKKTKKDKPADSRGVGAALDQVKETAGEPTSNGASA